MSFVFPASGVVSTPTYPTSINILLGGPGQEIGYTNSVNLKDTFALYVVALLMLWVVILLPFLLLQIFLDYLSNVSIAENSVVKRITSNSWFNRAYGGTPPVPGQPPQKPSPFGIARSLPFFNKRALEMPSSSTASTSERSSVSTMQTMRETKDVLRLANLSIPKMRDIAKYETSMTKHDTASRSEVSRFHDTLEKISKPTIVATPMDREKFTSIKEKLIISQKNGDPLATSVLNATRVSSKSTQIVRENTNTVIKEMLRNISSPELLASPSEKVRVTQIKHELIDAKSKGSGFASSILDVSEKLKSTTLTEEQKNTLVEKSIEQIHEQSNRGDKTALKLLTNKDGEVGKVLLPTVNHVQQVSIEEYEDVKKMWTENYQNMEAPIGSNGMPTDKHAFIQQDVENITETINLLSSENQENVDKGMDRVANILPFLLLGGFSKTEVISYLKAKMDAAKSVLTGVAGKAEDEDTMIERTQGQKSAQTDLVMHQEIPVEQSPIQKSADLKDSKNEKGPGNSENGTGVSN